MTEQRVLLYSKESFEYCLNKTKNKFLTKSKNNKEFDILNYT